MPKLIDLQSTDWVSEVVEEERPVMVEFWHNKCPVCIEMKPLVERLPEIIGDDVKFARMNLLESKENRVFAIRSGVRSTPTFVVYCRGEPTGQIIGGREDAEFIEEVKMLVSNADKCVLGTPIEEE